MPLYEYRCNDCAAVFDVMRAIADRELSAVCPRCESRASMPLISRVSPSPRSLADAAASLPQAGSAGAGGGCCGGSCGCG